MIDMSPVAWCLLTNKGEIINGVYEEERLAAQYRHRKADDTVTALYTSEQLAEAVAAEREKNAKACDDLSGQWVKCRNPKLSDAQYWEGKSNAALDCAEAIRSDAK